MNTRAAALRQTRTSEPSEAREHSKKTREQMEALACPGKPWH